MSSAPIDAEATGQPHIVAVYRGREYKLRTDADDWPLIAIANSVGIRDGRLVANYSAVADALGALLGDQWYDFIREFPQRRHLIPASQAFAAAAGFDGTADDLAFGALPRLLATLTDWPAAVEATLAMTNADYRDRFRFDADGRRRLTLRQIHVRLTYAPFNNPVAIAQNGGRPQLTGTEILLMDVYEAIARQRHPSRPMTDQQAATRETKHVQIEEERKKYRQRHNTPQARRKELAVATARANASPQGESHA